MAEILTNNAMFSSFMIVLIVFALGDIVGKITKGKLSGMMVVMLLFLVGFLTKLIPADIIDQGGLTALSKLPWSRNASPMFTLRSTESAAFWTMI